MADEKELTLSRDFDAPREVVWKAWTDPDIFMQWWGPRGFTTPISKIDLRKGGEYFNCMRAPDGQDFCSKGIYMEIVKPERLVITDSFADNDGNKVPATYYGMGTEFPMEMQVKVTFEEQNGRTKLIVKHSDVSNIRETELKDMQQGWNESLDKLAELLAKS